MVRNGSVPKDEGKQHSGEKRSGGSHLKDLRIKGRRFESPQMVQSYAATIPGVRPPKCERCGNSHSKDVSCWVCGRCRKLGHTERFCKIPKENCYECGKAGHIRDKCPNLVSSGSGTTPSLGARGRAFVMGAQEAQQDPRVVTGTFLICDQPAFILFDFGADRSFVSDEFRTLISCASSPLVPAFEIELADGQFCMPLN
jgi:hypothetical protein